MVADPGGVDPDPDSTFQKNPDSDPTVEKNQDPALEKHPDPNGSVSATLQVGMRTYRDLHPFFRIVPEQNLSVPTLFTVDLHLNKQTGA